MIEIETDRELQPEVRDALRREARELGGSRVRVGPDGVFLFAEHNVNRRPDRPFVRYDSLDVFLRFHPVSSQ